MLLDNNFVMVFDKGVSTLWKYIFLLFWFLFGRILKGNSSYTPLVLTSFTLTKGFVILFRFEIIVESFVDLWYFIAKFSFNTKFVGACSCISSNTYRPRSFLRQSVLTPTPPSNTWMTVTDFCKLRFSELDECLLRCFSGNLTEALLAKRLIISHFF